MANIKIHELLSIDSESYLNDLNNGELIFIIGGDDYAFEEVLKVGVKGLEFALVIFAINSIVMLVEKFINEQEI